MNKIPILFTFDENLLMPAGVCITSLLQNASEETFYDIFILHRSGLDFSQSKLAELPRLFGNCSLTFRSVGEDFQGAYQVRGIPETAYYRLIAPELIPEYETLLYSDVDVIFRDDLSHYYQLVLGNHYYGAVDNGVALRPAVQEYVTNCLKTDYHKGYYYSGNLLINCRQIRNDGLTKTFRELAKRNYWQQDMDIINIACNGRFLPIGPSFCLTNYLYSLIVKERAQMEAIYGAEELDYALSKGIVHYNGPKPWKEACMNLDIWWDYYRRSIFFDEQFAFSFWEGQTSVLERMSLWKRIKLVGRYFRKGGRK